MKSNIPFENWTKFPNSILDNLPEIDPYDFKIVAFMIRRTIGMLGLTNRPDERFSISFLSKHTGISPKQCERSRKSLVENGLISETGIAADGSKLYSINWTQPRLLDEPPIVPQTEPPSSIGRTYKESTIKKEKRKEESESSFQDSSGKESSFQLESEDPDPEMQKPIKTKKGHKQDLEGRFKPLLESFKNLHKEFRELDPIVNYPQEMKALKRLFIRFGTEAEILRQAKALMAYLRDGRKSQYGKTTPILPSQLTQPMLNRIQAYLDKDYDFVPTEAKEVIHNKKESFEEIL